MFEWELHEGILKWLSLFRVYAKTKQQSPSSHNSDIVSDAQSGPQPQRQSHLGTWSQLPDISPAHKSITAEKDF